MAKTSSIMRNEKRKTLTARAKKIRAELKKQIISGSDDRDEVVSKLAKRKRDESATRIRRRCRYCGRPRGNYRRVDLCRIHFREAAMRGDIPGLRKASW